MTRITLATPLLCILAAFATGCASSRAHFGGEMKLADSNTIPIATLIADAKSHEGKWVRTAGEVTEVCVSRGCWMRVAPKPGGEAIFVKFTCPIEGRLIPLEAVGKKTVVEGTLKLEEINEAEARHYAEDAGMSEEEIAKIKGPQKRLRLWDAAAEIEGVEVQPKKT